MSFAYFAVIVFQTFRPIAQLGDWRASATIAPMIADQSQPAAAPSAAPELVPASGGRSRWLRWGLTLGLGGLAVGAVFYDALTSGAGPLYLFQRFQTFVTIFLGIFIEAVPFLLAGSIVSGLIAVFVDQSMIDRYLPRGALPGRSPAD